MRPRLASTLVSLAVAVALSACDFHTSDPPLTGLVLVTIDTLRADRLGCYGHRAGTSPRIDALAARSLVYDHAYAHTPWTPPSHASILTGKLPPAHGLRQLWGDSLSPANTTLAQVLSGAGFATAAFVSSTTLRREVGLDRGFRLYDDLRAARLKQLAERPGDKTTDALLAWLDAHARERFFVWVHYFEPHGPYEHHPEYDAAARQTGIDPPDGKDDLASLLYRYDSEIFFDDAQVGRVLDRLNALGIAGTTAVVLTADHGEHFGEHGLFGHLGVYEQVLRVPLIIYDPRRSARPERIASVAAHVDTFPTVLRLLGEEGPATAHGRLLPPFASAAGGRPLYAEHADARTLAFALREDDWKLIAWGWPELAPPVRRELYDLASDPAEQRDVKAAAPERTDAMTRRLAEYRTAPPNAPRLHVTPDPSVAEKLRSLGYVE